MTRMRMRHDDTENGEDCGENDHDDDDDDDGDIWLAGTAGESSDVNIVVAASTGTEISWWAVWCCWRFFSLSLHCGALELLDVYLKPASKNLIF